MASFLPRRWKRQPLNAVRVGWGSPLVQETGLLWVWVGNDPRIVQRSPFVYGSDAVIGTHSGVLSPGAMDIALAQNYTKGSSQYTDLGFGQARTVISVGTILRTSDANAFALSCSSASGSQGFEFLIGVSGAAGVNAFRIPGSSTSLSATTSGHNDGRFHHYIGRWDTTVNSGALDLVADGVALGTGSGTMGTVVTSTQNWRIASRATTYFSGDVALAYVSGIRVSDGQAKALNDDIWGIFEPIPPARIYSFPSGASSGTTVAVPKASLVLTGYAPTVLTPQVVQVPKGGLVLTGYAPDVLTPVTVLVPKGTLTITGYAPTIVVTSNKLIEAPKGALVLRGYAPTVLGTVVATSNRGSYSEPDRKLRERLRRLAIQQAHIEDDEEALAILLATIMREYR